MTETVDIRAKTRRVKDHILNRFLLLADKVDKEEILRGSDKEVYEQLLLTFARNVIPRSQEIGGDPDNETPVPILMTTNVPTHQCNSKDIPANTPD
jgi:hypothetical protein